MRSSLAPKSCAIVVRTSFTALFSGRHPTPCGVNRLESITMYQIIFKIPFLNLPIYGYGLMLVIAFLACIYAAKRMARHLGLDGELYVNMALIALVAGVAGARISHVLENIGTYTNPERSFMENLLDAVN